MSGEPLDRREPIPEEFNACSQWEGREGGGEARCNSFVAGKISCAGSFVTVLPSREGWGHSGKFVVIVTFPSW